jgi:hypothetical protein
MQVDKLFQLSSIAAAPDVDGDKRTCPTRRRDIHLELLLLACASSIYIGRYPGRKAEKTARWKVLLCILGVVAVLKDC